MTSNIIKILPVNPDLSVIVFDHKGRTHISIKQNEKINNRPGEIIITPEEVPSLEKTLAEAAVLNRNLA